MAIIDPNEIWKYKKPSKTNKRKYIGIELECSSPIPDQSIHDFILKHKLNKYLQLGFDGRANVGEISYEFKILIHKGEIKTILPRVGDFLKDIKASINRSHGMHVHLDMRHRNVQKSFNNLVRSQELLYKMSDKNRRTNHFCYPQRTHILQDADKNHYAAISPILEPVKDTIEVRIKEGLVDVNSIQNWIVLLNKIADASTINNDIKTLNDIEKVMKINKQMKEYIFNSVKIFKGKSKIVA